MGRVDNDHSGLGTDLSIGSPVAARKYEELEPLIGFFVNTLVLRVDLSGDPGFEEALARVREVSLAAYMHQEVPFEKLVEELAPERSLAYSPIFQILMVLQNAPREEMRVDELEMEGLRLSGTTAKFDLVLSLEEGPASVSGALEYNIDLFDDATMARLLAHFETLLSAATEHPEARLSDLPLLGEAVRALLLREWNDTPSSWSRSPSTSGSGCSLQGCRAAGNRLAWGELDLRRAERPGRPSGESSALHRGPARRPRRSLDGARSGVGDGGPRSAQGRGAYLPIDPNYPGSGWTSCSTTRESRLLLIQSEAAPAVAGRPVRAVLVDEVSAGVETPSAGGSPGPHRGGLASLCNLYLGLDGPPKGIVLPHRTSPTWSPGRSPPPLGPRRATLQLASPSFDVSLQEMFTTWCAGGTLIIAPEEARRDSERLGAVPGRAERRASVRALRGAPATGRISHRRGGASSPR